MGKASLLAYVMGQCMSSDMETNMGDLGLGWVAYQGITFAMIPPLHTSSLVLVPGAFTFACVWCGGGKKSDQVFTHTCRDMIGANLMNKASTAGLPDAYT